MKNAMRSATPHYTWIQGSYWMADCILFSFSSLYLLDRGGYLPDGEIGLLLGLAGGLGFPIATLGRRTGRPNAPSLSGTIFWAPCCRYGIVSRGAPPFSRERVPKLYYTSGCWCFSISSPLCSMPWEWIVSTIRSL